MTLALLILTSCTIGGSSVRDASTHHHLAIVPAAALDHQNPGADTSKNPVISRDVATNDEVPSESTWRGGSYDALAAIGYALAISAYARASDR